MLLVSGPAKPTIEAALAFAIVDWQYLTFVLLWPPSLRKRRIRFHRPRVVG